MTLLIKVLNKIRSLVIQVDSDPESGVERWEYCIDLLTELQDANRVELRWRRKDKYSLTLSNRSLSNKYADEDIYVDDDFIGGDQKYFDSEEIAIKYVMKRFEEIFGERGRFIK